MFTEKDFKDRIREIPDYPKKGILFYDITTLVKDPEAYHELISQLADSIRDLNIDVVIGPEARGFVIGAPVAYALGAGFVLARKPGKLPAEVYRNSYGLEYGSDCLEIHRDAVKPGQRVALVDDLLATGGTAAATVKLIKDMGAEVAAAAFAVELTDLDGRNKLDGTTVRSVIKY